MHSKKKQLAIITILTAVIFIALFYRDFYISGVVKNVSKPEVTVPVKTAKIVVKSISKSISAYGTVIPAPGAIDVLSVPFESYITRLMVSNGQMISKGDPLLVIQPSQNTYLSLLEAKASYETTKQSLQHVTDLLKLKLATNDQFLNAQLAFQQAQLRLEYMNKQQLEGPRNLLASVDGLIRMVNVQQGAIVPASTTLIEIVHQDHFEVNLGIEAEDMSELKLGQMVVLSPVYKSTASKVVGQIRKLAYAVNPTSRLVDIFVTIPSLSSFLLGELVLGDIEIASQQGMVVPRSAILPEGDHFILFTVKNDRAVKHIVQIGIDSADEVSVLGKTLVANEPVVILGNYELRDGMNVQIQGGQ